MAPETPLAPPSLWERHQMAVDRVAALRDRITSGLNAAGVAHALVGGQAVAYWVATIDPDAVRTTKHVDLLIRRADLPGARAAAASAGFDYFEVLGVGMFLDRADPYPRKAVHLVWAGEKVKAQYPLPSPPVESRTELEPGRHVVNLPELIRMKLMANRHHDLAHLTDLIDVGLVTRAHLADLPPDLAARLESLLHEQGR
jgi:hypothetical protein